MLSSINPSTGELIREYPETSALEQENLLRAAAAAFRQWKLSSFEERSERLLAARQVLLAKKEKLARLMTQEMGKPIVQARTEIEKCALGCEFYARNGAKFLAPEEVATDARRSYVSFEPLGVVLAVMPW
ncbi:MAG TPA: succinate-semialdehyde dehydrogenase, partial [Deltaproteobacteria bacterium]|nr:succinate-semialdehyde dehydrogenase [Deltaproteobacteria bacterium]